MQNQIKVMTPQAKLGTLDLRNMDARCTIERHNQLRTNLLRKFSGQFQGKCKSASPARFRAGFNTQNTNLKVFKYRNCSGNLEDAFTVTTQVISGHNTPLTQMRKRREKFLNQINDQQDELLAQLRAKEAKLALKNLKASRIFDGFVSNLEQQGTPDRRANPSGSLKRHGTVGRLDDADTEDPVEAARQSMYTHKLKPLHTTASFHSWRSDIQRSIDEGVVFSEPRADRKVPRRFDKHLTQVKLARLQARELDEQCSRSSLEDEAFSEDQRAIAADIGDRIASLPSLSPTHSAGDVQRRQLLNKDPAQMSKKEQNYL